MDIVIAAVVVALGLVIGLIGAVTLLQRRMPGLAAAPQAAAAPATPLGRHRPHRRTEPVPAGG